MIHLQLLFLVVTFIFHHSECEEIKSLPGLEHNINFKHYSGYLQARPTRFLHYWFVESQGHPETDPLMIWFNGGPGCSSLLGLVQEMGPFLINDDGKTLKENPHSWNKVASVLYIESPAGVGFSYSTDGNLTHNDDSVAAESYEAIKNFFEEFPQFRKNDLHIFGESYGGVYVPTLTANIIRGQSKYWMNLKSIGIGNGILNQHLQDDTFFEFFYGHGLIDSKTWASLEKCCGTTTERCGFKENGACYADARKAFYQLIASHLNIYDVAGRCDNVKGLEAMSNFMEYPLDQRFFRYRRNAEKHSNDTVYYSTPLCFNGTYINSYLNSYPVRRALHIPDHVLPWEMCSDEDRINYTKQYLDMAPFINEILEANIRVLLYFGDTDSICNFLHGQKFVDLLGLKQIGNYEPWTYKEQIGGMKSVYEGLTYVTVRGAGHLVPQSKPAESLHLVKQFLSNKEI